MRRSYQMKRQRSSNELVRVCSQEDLSAVNYKYYSPVNSDSDSPTHIYTPNEVEEERTTFYRASRGEDYDRSTQSASYYQMNPQYMHPHQQMYHSAQPKYVVATETESTEQHTSSQTSNSDASREVMLSSSSASGDQFERELLSDNGHAEDEHHHVLSESDVIWDDDTTNDSEPSPVVHKRRVLLGDNPSQPTTHPSPQSTPEPFDPTRPPPPIDRSRVFLRGIPRVQSGFNRQWSNQIQRPPLIGAGKQVRPTIRNPAGTRVNRPNNSFLPRFMNSDHGRTQDARNRTDEAPFITSTQPIPQNPTPEKRKPAPAGVYVPPPARESREQNREESNGNFEGSGRIKRTKLDLPASTASQSWSNNQQECSSDSSHPDSSEVMQSGPDPEGSIPNNQSANQLYNQIYHSSTRSISQDTEPTTHNRRCLLGDGPQAQHPSENYRPRSNHESPTSPELWAQPTTENYGEFSLNVSDDENCSLTLQKQSTPQMSQSTPAQFIAQSTPHTSLIQQDEEEGTQINSGIDSLCASEWPSLNTPTSNRNTQNKINSSNADENGQSGTTVSNGGNLSWRRAGNFAKPKISFALPAGRSKLLDISMPIMNTKKTAGNEESVDTNQTGSVSPSKLADKQKKTRWSLPGTSSRPRELYLPGKDDSPGRPSFGDSWNSSSAYDDSEWIADYQQKHFVSQVPFIDSHCHLDFLFQRKRHNGSLNTYMYGGADKIAQQTTPTNFAGCLAIFCDPVFWKLERKWKALLSEDFVWGSFGVHPKSAQQWNPLTELMLRDALRHPKVKAVGEIGLDYSKGLDNFKEKQKEAFIAQIKIAVEFKRPLVIHCRDAEEDCFNIMAEHVPRDHKIHRHCFTEDWQTAHRLFMAYPNLMIGLTPLVTFPTARSTHAVAKQVNLNRLLLETDCPYFIPRGIPRDRMPHSHPGMAITVAVEVARLKNISVDKVLQETRENTRDMYGI